MKARGWAPGCARAVLVFGLSGAIGGSSPAIAAPPAADPPVPPAAAPAAPESPKKVGLKETVQMNLVQLEVTVWPKKEGSDACLGLTKDDFELFVDRKPQPIYAVDSMGVDDEVLPPGTPASVAEGLGHGLSIVLFFDLWHLNTFHPFFTDCPITKPLAFNEARRYVREEFREGDRLLLVTAMGWPRVHYGWIRTQAEALRALDRLENNSEVMMPRQEHQNHIGWVAGMESFFLALGRYPGRKDVIYLADDFRFDDVALRMYELVARAQSNGVVMNAVDLVETCRNIPGPGCRGTATMGLGCSEFKYPVALAPLTGETGGVLFKTERIASAVRELRSLRKCRYVVSFRKDARKSKRVPTVRLELKGDRTDITLLAPSSYQTPEKAPTERDKNEALFLLPQFGKGIAAKVALWPYKYDVKASRWKSFVLARVDRTDDEPWADELNEITVNVLVHKKSEPYGEWRKKITGPDLERLRGGKGSKLMLFPVEGLRPGDTTVDLTVTSNVEDVSANVRRSMDVPKPPKPGEARPWFLSDHQLRIGESTVLAPSLDDVVMPEETVSFIGYGCPPRDGGAAGYAGRLVPFGGGPALSVPIRWLEEHPPEPAPGAASSDRGHRDAKGACGWLVGRIESPLAAGLWTFELPLELQGGKKPGAAVEFNVVSATPSAAPPSLPAELKPRP